MWRKIFKNTTLQKAEKLWKNGNVNIDVVEDDYIAATVEDDRPVCVCNVEIEYFEGEELPGMWCDCEAAFDGDDCEHMAAVMYEIEAKKLHKARQKKVAAKKKTAVLFEEKDDQYQYYNLQTIVQDVQFSDTAIKEAKKNVESGQIALEDIQVGYYHDFYKGDVQRAHIMGKYQDKKGNAYHVAFQMDKESILEMSCMVPRCNCRYMAGNYYWGVQEKKACSHVTALMLLVHDYLKTHTIGDATDYSGIMMLESFRNLYARKAACEPQNQDIVGKVDIQPRLILENDELHLSFKIGRTKLYVMKNIKDFYFKNKKKEILQLGKNESIDLATAIFTENAKRYLEYINREVKQELQHKSRLEQKNSSWYATEVKAETMSSYIDLYGTRLDDFFELEYGKSLAFINKDTGEKEKEILLKDGVVKAEIELFPQTSKTVLESISIEGTMPVMINGSKHQYYVEEDAFCRLSDESRKQLEPILNLFEDGELDIHIGRNNIAEFYYRILPELEKCANITNHVGDIVEDLLPKDMDVIFYIDAEKEYLLCRPIARYEDATFSIIDMVDTNGIHESYRDKLKETEAFELVKQYFPKVLKAETDENEQPGSEKYVLACPNDEEAVYYLLNQGISQLMTIGEVHCTDRFKNRNRKKNLKIAVGVSVQSDLMNLEISSEDISPRELLDILSSYRLKKKYHRLKSGEFVDINDDSIAELSDMMEAMHISAKEFVAGKMSIPLYRALYLDKMLENCTEIYLNRDGYFRNLVKGFKTINDADYEPPQALKKVLRNYQEYGHKWIRVLTDNNFGGILADDMGLGKTLQMISVLAAVKENGQEGTSLIVCPASLVYNWQEEFSRFAPTLKTQVVVGKASERKEITDNYRDYDVIITSYDLLKRDVVEYEDKQFEYQVIDEAQYIKTHTTAAAKSVKIIHAKHKMALTGTPIENRLSELWSIFDYLMPGFLYSYDVFKKEIETPIVKQKDEEATKRLKRMVSPFILRRLKTDVLKDLPDKIEELQYAHMDETQQLLYDAQVAHMKDMLMGQDEAEFKKNKIQILSELTRIRQICCDPALMVENYHGDSAKKEACLDLIERAIEGDHKMLIFSQFTTMLDILAKELEKKNISYYTITGATPKEKRLELVKSFNTNDVPVFLISLKAGGTGLNLTGADMVIHYDPWWNVAAQNQATDRAHRIGQSKIVTVYKLIVKGTIEEKIVKMQQDKADLANEILSGENGNIVNMTREDLLELL